MNKFCRTCCFVRGNHCQVNNWDINPSADTCPHHTMRLEACSKCGRQGPAQAFLWVDGKNELLCEQCYNILDTCQSCGAAQSCAFETDPSLLPKVVMRQVRQGNMVMQTQVRNPDREEITCKKGCKCYNNDFGCQRQAGCCVNYYEGGSAI